MSHIGGENRETNLPVNSACSKQYLLGCFFLAIELQSPPMMQITITISSEHFNFVQVGVVVGKGDYSRRVQLNELSGERLPFVLP
jgi:hypothetical protein